MGKQKGQQLSARALALPFSPTLTLSCAYERDCVCVCVREWSVECECGLCATPAEMLAAVGSIALAQPSAKRTGGRAVGRSVRRAGFRSAWSEILRKSFIMSPMAAL